MGIEEEHPKSTVLEYYLKWLNFNTNDRQTMLKRAASKLDSNEKEIDEIWSELEEARNPLSEVQATRAEIGDRINLNIYNISEFAGSDIASTAHYLMKEKDSWLVTDPITKNPLEEDNKGKISDEDKRFILEGFYDRWLTPEEIAETEERGFGKHAEYNVKRWLRRAGIKILDREESECPVNDVFEKTRKYEVLEEIDNWEEKAVYWFLDKEGPKNSAEIATYFIRNLGEKLERGEEYEILENSNLVVEEEPGVYRAIDEMELTELEETVIEGR